MAREYRRNRFGEFAKKEVANQLRHDFLVYKDKVSRAMVRHFTANAQKFMAALSQEDVPEDTGNLHDSIGIGIALDGEIKKWKGHGGLTYLKTAKPITSYHFVKKETKKGFKYRRQYTEQRWGSFAGIISSGHGSGRDRIKVVDRNLHRKVDAFKGDPTFLCYAAMPYAYPLNLPGNKIHAGWFDRLKDKFCEQIIGSIKYGFIADDVFHSLKYLNKDEEKIARKGLYVELNPAFIEPKELND